VESGYDTWTRSYAYGENIAFGYSSAAEVVAAWMNSPGHRANILSPFFTEIGVSVLADAADPVGVWRQFCAEAGITHLGTLRPPPPVQQELF